jgi:hypothetical protein
MDFGCLPMGAVDRLACDSLVDGEDNLLARTVATLTDET